MSRALSILSLQSTGAMKAAAALDSFANVTHGFAALLIGDCFEDVVITSVNVSQKSNPWYRRVPNPDTSSTAYSDHIEKPAEIVPSATDLVTGGIGSSRWIVTFMLITVLSTMLCTCLGTKFIHNGYGGALTAAAYASHHPEDEQNNRATFVDGSTLDTPTKSPAYNKANRMFSPHPEAAGAPKKGRPRRSPKEKRAALNARNIPTTRDPNEDFEVLSSGSDGTEDTESPASQSHNPMYKKGHVPRLSALDFGRTIDEDKEDDSDVASEFWRLRHRGNDGS